jgi:nucleotide-binding universal stress UspA family protein
MASPQIAPLDTDEMCSATSAGTFCMANILLPVDFSEPCARAVHHASTLSRCFGSEVTLLHVQAAVLDFEGQELRVEREARILRTDNPGRPRCEEIAA